MGPLWTHSCPCCGQIEPTVLVGCGQGMGSLLGSAGTTAVSRLACHCPWVWVSQLSPCWASLFLEKQWKPKDLWQYCSSSPEVPNQSVFFYPTFWVLLTLSVELFLGYLVVLRGKRENIESMLSYPRNRNQFLTNLNYCSEKGSIQCGGNASVCFLLLFIHSCRFKISNP